MLLVDQQILRIPGPTPIPPTVQRAMNKPMIGHRSAETTALLDNVRPKLKKVFGTTEEIAIIAGSGTAGMETAFVNAIHPGEEVLVVETGAFGQRFGQICETHEANVHRLQLEWGQAATPERVQAYVEENPKIAAVFITYCETSTGVLNPIQEIAAAVRTVSNALIIIDGVSSIAGTQLEMDLWGIDIAVTGSQKAFMLPAGLAFVACSARAWEKIEANTRPSFYFNLKKYRDNIEKCTTPFTPASSLLFGLEEVLNTFEIEGLDHIYKRHLLMMNMTRAALKALHLPLLAEDAFASPTVTAVRPTTFKATDFRKILQQEFNLVIAGGQQHLKDEIFRIGHMGYCSPADVLQTIGAIEIALQKIGHTCQLGAGTAAAQQVYLQEEK